MGRHSLKKQYSKKLIAAVSAGAVILLLSFYFLFNGFNLPFFFPGQQDEPEIVETIEPSPTVTPTSGPEEPTDLESENLQEIHVPGQTESQQLPQETPQNPQVPQPAQPEQVAGEPLPAPVPPVIPSPVIPVPPPVILSALPPVIPQIPLPLPLPLPIPLPPIQEIVPGIEITVEPLICTLPIGC